MIEKRDYIIILYDYYNELLNDKQKEYFESYYFNNLSLSEISENLNISRNAIHKALKIVENKLIDYESKLNLYSKSLKINKLLNNINEDNINKIKELI